MGGCGILLHMHASQQHEACKHRHLMTQLPDMTACCTQWHHFLSRLRMHTCPIKHDSIVISSVLGPDYHAPSKTLLTVTPLKQPSMPAAWGLSQVQQAVRFCNGHRGTAYPD